MTPDEIAEGRALLDKAMRCTAPNRHWAWDEWEMWIGNNADRLLNVAAQAEAAGKDAARLREALNAIMIEPYGCRFCSSGKLIKPNDPEKDHDDDCGFLLARAALAAIPQEDHHD